MSRKGKNLWLSILFFLPLMASAGTGTLLSGANLKTGGGAAGLRRLDDTSPVTPVSRQRPPGLITHSTVATAPAWNWANPLPNGTTFYGMVTGGNATVAVGGDGNIYTSTGNGNFTKAFSGTSKSLFAVTYGGGLFVAVGDGAIVLTSPNGVNWTTAVLDTSGILSSVV